MASSLSNEEVHAFRTTEEYKTFVAHLKSGISGKKLTLSPNDVPEVVAPMEPEVQRRLFAKGFSR
jgi:hypothetical protein